MSVSSITTLGVARDNRVPTRVDAASAARGRAGADEPPSTVDVLAKTLPVGLVSAYTAFTAVVTQVVREPTVRRPDPELYLVYRWGALVVLVLAAGIATYRSYRAKGGSRRFCWPEVTSVVVAAAAWGLAVPASPLLVSLDDRSEGLLAIGAVGFAGVACNVALAGTMRRKAAD